MVSSEYPVQMIFKDLKMNDLQDAPIKNAAITTVHQTEHHKMFLSYKCIIYNIFIFLQ